MPEIDDDYESLVGDPDAETPLVKRLRQQLKDASKSNKGLEARLAELEQQANRAVQLEREVAFVKAGVPSDHPVAKLLMSTYDGPATVEAITEAWKQLGVATQPAEKLPSTTDHRFDDEMAAADRLSQAQTGTLSPDREAAYLAAMREASGNQAKTLQVLQQYGKLGALSGDQ